MAFVDWQNWLVGPEQLYIEWTDSVKAKWGVGSLIADS